MVTRMEQIDVLYLTFFVAPRAISTQLEVDRDGLMRCFVAFTTGDPGTGNRQLGFAGSLET